MRPAQQSPAEPERSGRAGPGADPGKPMWSGRVEPGADPGKPQGESPPVGLLCSSSFSPLPLWPREEMRRFRVVPSGRLTALV